MYSELCAKCAEKFPEFKDELNPDAKPHTFKRLLLNKCQVRRIVLPVPLCSLLMR